VRACGENDSVLYKKGGSQLATIPGYYSSPYFPPGAWVRDTVDLISYAGKSDVSIAFGNIGYGGQILYIDEFLVDELNSHVSVETINSSDVNVFPNPARDHVFVRINHNIKGEYYLTDIFGNTVKSGPIDRNNIAINISGLACGFYFMHVGGGEFKVEKY
jgi:hypothetical protein